MKDFKTIDELNIFECYEIVKEGEGHPFFNQVKTRFGQELMVLKEEEKKDFESCKNSTDYERFLSKYRQYTVFYSMQYKKKAEDALDNLYWQSRKTTLDGCQSYLSRYPHGIYCHEARKTIDSIKRKRLWAKVISIVVLLVALTIAFFVGYEPADYISLSDSSLSFSKYGEAKIVKISTNASIYDCGAESSDYWITISKSEYKFTLTAKPNPNPDRDGYVTFYAYSTLYGNNLFRKEIKLPIKQDSGKPSYLSISKDNFQFDKKGTGIGEFIVTTDGVNISTDCSKDWVHISHDDQVNSSTEFRISVDLNDDDWRHACVKIIVGDFEKTIRISQESGKASRLELDKNSISIGEEGTGEGFCLRFHVSTDGASWSANTNYKWISLNQYGNTLDIEISKNDGGDVRSGYVSVNSNNGHSESISIKQDGNPTEFYTSYSSYTFDTDKDYDYISFTCNSEKTVVTSVNKGWLSACISGNSVRISCEKNDNPPRDAVVTLKCGSKSTSISVHQKGWEDCYRCGGSGYLTTMNWEQTGGNYWNPIMGIVYYKVDCPNCRNSGKRGKIKAN